LKTRDDGFPAVTFRIDAAQAVVPCIILSPKILRATMEISGILEGAI
jgi:hypothetical protein